MPINADSVQYYSLKLLEKLTTDNRDITTIKAAMNILLQVVQEFGQLAFVPDCRIDKVLKYIHENYQLNLSNKALASLLNIDHRYFIRLFKSSCGRTPQEYVSYYKAFQATHLLMGGHQVKEVADMVGFEDTKAFSRFFKTHRGVSPSLYKKSYYLQP